MEKIKTKRILKELKSIIKSEFPSDFKFKFNHFAFFEIDNTDMGWRLAIKHKGFFGNPVMEVDLKYSPGSYDRNRISVKETNQHLLNTIESYFKHKDIPYQIC